MVSNPPVICATQTPVILDVQNSDAESITFPSMTNPIHTLLPSSAVSIKDTNFIAADNARFITVFDPKAKGIAYNLVAEKEVASLTLSTNAESSKEEQEGSPLEKQVLAVLVEDGTVELFNRPFLQSADQKATSAKARAKQMTRKADAILKIVRPDTGKAVSAVQVGFQGSELFVAWAEGGVNVIFERVRWQDKDTGSLIFSGATEITGRKSASVLRSAAAVEERQASKSRVNESRAVVESGLYAEDVEMNDANIEDDAVSISDAEDTSDVEGQTKKVNGINGVGKDAESGDDEDDAEEEDGEEEANGEPTFGELVQRNSAIDVEAELEYDAGSGALVPVASNKNKAVTQIPSGVSLTTVLSQALKTNDAEMLESCFRTSDTNIIRSTVQRLNSTLAGTLIQRIAERMASRPGRYGHLLAWVQWTCIAHGGAIAGNNEILKRMTSLYKVMDQRSRSLPSLLLLKGKLDMLDAQINLRQSMADSRKHGMDDGELLESVTHYAGVNNDDDSEAERQRKRKRTAKSTLEDEDVDVDDEMDDGLGLGSDDDEDEGSEEDADEDGDMIDIEAEESLDDDDDDDDDEEDEEEDGDSASDMDGFIVDSEEEEIPDSEAEEPEEKQTKRSSSKKAKVNNSRR